jgi:hypothetical protein
MLRTAIFHVTADIQNDVYHLFAYDGKTKGYAYVNIAYIGTRQLSVYMNNLFRNIRENKNVDYGEESEDEETFQNVNPDKYVDLKKEYKMNCVFNNKFKKWVPVNVVDTGSHCVNINDLLFQNNNNQNQLNYPKPNSSYSNSSYPKPSYSKPSYSKPSYSKPSYSKPSYSNSNSYVNKKNK